MRRIASARKWSRLISTRSKATEPAGGAFVNVILADITPVERRARALLDAIGDSARATVLASSDLVGARVVGETGGPKAHLRYVSGTTHCK